MAALEQPSSFERKRPIPEKQPAWRAIELGIKQARERLSDEDFKEYLECEMMYFTGDVPPLRTPFDPAVELRKLKKTPREERAEAIEVFKDSLMRQRLAYRQCRLLLEQSIERDPDIKLTNLTQIPDFFARNYGFPLKARRTISDILHEYARFHRNTHQVRLLYPNDAELVERLTGVTIPPEEAHVEEGPASIDIFTGSKYANEIFGVDTNSKDMSGFQGFSSKHRVYYTVVSEDAPDFIGTHIHEREHVKNKIIQHFFDVDDRKKLLGLPHDVEGISDTKERETVVEEELCLQRDIALDQAKDELLAMFKDGKSNYFEYFFAKDGNVYDFLKKDRDTYGATTLYEKAVQKILIEEYERIIRNAKATFENLLKTKRYSSDELIALFTDTELERWPNMARRVEEYFAQQRAQR